MAPADTDRRAEREVRHAVENILERAGCHISQALSGEIHQAYTGRGWTPAPSRTAYCRTHPSTRTPCGLCPPGV